MKWQTKEDMKTLLVNLVEHPSITGSVAELAISEYIHLRLRELDYFQKHPYMLELHPTKDGRKFITALVKKKNAKKTVVLLSHFDVVDIEDYGEWKNLAFRPNELTERFYANRESMPDAVQKDLESDQWLFGRGTMDMKAGLTLEMSLIEAAATGEFDGNLLLLSVPDEEANSAGMTQAAEVLLELAYKFDLKYNACLNTEPVFSRYPGDENMYIYSGSIGKMLPGFFCYGTTTHVGEPFAGVNANLMVSELNRLLELNTDFCETVDDEVTPPPTNLMQKDLKENYSVQIPHAAVTNFNLLLMEGRLEDKHQKLLEIAREAAGNIQRHIKGRAEEFASWVEFSPKQADIRVLTYEELKHEAINRYGKSEIERREMYTLAHFNELGDRDLSTQLIYDLAGLCKDLGPMIVLFYQPPFYPAISSRHNKNITGVIDKMIEAAGDEGVTLHHQKFFPGLSDLSYAGLTQSKASLYQMVGNMPIYNKRYELPFDALSALDIPVMNLGPRGRDAHQWTERLDADFSFGILRKLLGQTVEALLKTENLSEIYK